MKINSSFLSSLISVGGSSLLLNIARSIMILIATRYVSTDELGVYFILIAAAGIITTVAGFGTNTSLVKHAVEEESYQEKISIVTSCLLFFGGMLLVVICFALVLNNYIGYVEIHDGYIVLCLSYALFFYLNYALQGLKNFSAISYSNLVNAATKVVLVVLLVVVLKLGFNGLIWSIIASNLLGSAMQLLMIYRRQNIFKSFKYNKIAVKRIVRFGVPIYINQIYSNLYDRGYTILIAVMLDPVAVAYYGIATMIPAFINQLRQVFSDVYFPKFCELQKQERYDESRKLLSLSISVIFVIVSFGAILFYIFDEQLISVLFSEKYIAVNTAIFILLSRSAISFCSAVMGYTLIGLGKNTIPLRINLFITTFSFVTSYFVIPDYGYMGVVYVAFISSIMGFCLNAYSLYLVRKTLELTAYIWVTLLLLTVLVFATAIGLTEYMNYGLACFIGISLYALNESGAYKALKGSISNV